MFSTFLLLSIVASAIALPTTPRDPCEGVLGCNNHGVCAGTLEEGLYCICDPGYFGLRCQLPDDEPVKKADEKSLSRKNPCEGRFSCNNHGECSSDNEGVFFCSCNPGWYGVRCQIPAHQLVLLWFYCL